MVESMLRHVRHAAALDFHDGSGGWLQLAQQTFDHRALSSAVRADDGHAGEHGDLHANTVELRLGGARILKVNVVHF